MKRPMVTLVLAALAAATLLDTDAAVAAAQQIRYAPVRVPLVDALRPVDAVTGALGLNAPADALARAAGNPRTGSTDGDPRGLGARARAVAARPPAEPPTPAPARTSAPPGPAPVPYISDGPAGDALPATSAGRPLRVLFTGDSTAGEPGYAMSDLLAAAGRTDIDVRDEPFTGTGLTRPGAFDWSRMATQQSQAYQPDVVVVFLGENDGYPLGGASPYSDAWADQYADRVEAVTDAYLAGGVRQVIWAAPPIDAQTSPWEGSNVNAVFRNIGGAIRRVVATVPGTAMVDQYPLFSVDGHFSHPVPDPGTGTVVDARAADGSHLTRAGGAIVARLLLRHLDRDRQPRAQPTPSPSPVPASAAPPGQFAGGRLLSHSSPVPAHRSTAPYTWSAMGVLVLLRIARRRLAVRARAVRVGIAVALADAVLMAPALIDAARTRLGPAAGGAARALAGWVAALDRAALADRAALVGRAVVAARAAVARRAGAAGRAAVAVRPRDRRGSGFAAMPPGTPMFPATRTPPRAHSASRPQSGVLPSVPAVSVTVRPGTFCAVEGSWGRDADGRLLRCTRTPGGQRLRWRLPAEPVRLPEPGATSPSGMPPVTSDPT